MKEDPDGRRGRETRRIPGASNSPELPHNSSARATLLHDSRWYFTARVGSGVIVWSLYRRGRLMSRLRFGRYCGFPQSPQVGHPTAEVSGGMAGEYMGGPVVNGPGSPHGLKPPRPLGFAQPSGCRGSRSRAGGRGCWRGSGLATRGRCGSSLPGPPNCTCSRESRSP